MFVVSWDFTVMLVILSFLQLQGEITLRYQCLEWNETLLENISCSQIMVNIMSNDSKLPDEIVRQASMLRWWLGGQSLTFLIWALFCVSAEITVPIEKDFKIDSKEIVPPPEFLNDNASSGDHSHNCFASSAVIPSLPLTIKWLQDCVKEHPSTRLQVTMT